MNCLVCQKDTLDDITPLCADHAPAWGKCRHLGKTTIIPGDIKLLDVIAIKLMRRKLIRWWLGSDIWLLYSFPRGRGKLSVLRHRLKYHLTKNFVDENWLDSEKLLEEFVSIGGERAIVRYHVRGMLTEKVKRIEHEGINIAYYWPKDSGEYQEEVYGVDMVKKLIYFYPQVNWLRLDGTLNMREIYPTLDGYIRPNRHDGGSRLIRECKLNGIPYYRSEDGKPDLDDMCDFVEWLISAKPIIVR